MIQSGIFESLQKKIDDDTAVKDVLATVKAPNENRILTRLNSNSATSSPNWKSKVRRI